MLSLYYIPGSLERFFWESGCEERRLPLCILPKTPAHLPPQHRRQRHRDIVGDRLAEDNAGETETCLQQIEERDQQHALAKHREDSGFQGVSYGLKAVHVDEEKADHRTGQHVGGEHLHTVADYLVVIDKEADDGFPEDKVKQSGQDSYHQAAPFGKALYRAEPLHVAGAVVVAQKGLYAVCRSRR